MVKDYTTEQQQKVARAKLSATVIAIITFAIISPLAMYFVKYYKLKNAQPTQATTKPAKTNHSTTFDFYSLLSKTEVHIPTQSTNKVPHKAASYILQIASLKNQKQATVLKKQLFSLGYRSYIQKYQNDDDTWYRVLIGPYYSITAVRNDQKQLNSLKIHSILRRNKKP